MVIGNSQSLSQYEYQVHGLLYKWLNRRSQKRSYTWRALSRVIKRYQVPPPRIVETGRPRQHESCSLAWKIGQVIALDLYGQHYQRAGA